MMMKKIYIIALLSVVLSCSSKKTASEKASEPVVQYRDDFKATSEKNKKNFLGELKATEKKYSVILLTKGYMGEDLILLTEEKTLYKGNPITNLGTGIAGYIRIENAFDTKIKDKSSKQEAVINSADAKKYKFIYIMKDNALPNPYKITYSNTLRPLK